jgi:hypothetical protein
MEFMEIFGLTSSKTIMNSFVDTVPRKSREGGASGEKGQGEEIYSGAEERDGGKKKLKAKRTSKSSVGGGAGEKSSNVEAAERAIAALKRTRAPFIADASVIGRADETTLPLQEDDDVEITLEEFPVSGQRFGHRGWVAGGGKLDEEEDEVEQAGGAGADLLSSGGRQKKIVEDGKPGGKGQLGAGKAKGDKLEPKIRARKKEKSTLEVKWSSDDDDPDADDGDSLGEGSKLGVGRESAVKHGGKGKQDKPHEHDGEGGGTSSQQILKSAHGGQAAIPKSEEPVRAAQVKIKTFLDERNAKGGNAARADLKRERRTTARAQSAVARKQAGAAKKLQQDFDDAMDELRNAKPLLLGVSGRGENRVVIWGRTAALTAMREVGLTSETWGDYGEEDQDSLLESALEWLEEHKPKSKHTFGAEGEAEKESERASGADSEAGDEMRSPALKQAEVEGDAEVDDGDQDGRQSDVGGDGAVSDGAPESDVRDQEPGSKNEQSAGEEKAGEDATSRRDKRQRVSLGEGLEGPRANRSERRELQRLRERKEREAERERKREERERVTPPPPRSVGRSKAAELEEHKRNTRKREKARRDAMELVGEALKQQKRSKAGAVLTADEKELSKFAKTLSPVKLLGAGFRLHNDKDEDIVLSDDEDALEELMQGTGCGLEDAKEALNRSCEWTASGRPSRVKAARWLLEQEEEREHGRGNQPEHEEDNDWLHSQNFQEGRRATTTTTTYI